jgi:hypothetical protein
VFSGNPANKEVAWPDIMEPGGAKRRFGMGVNGKNIIAPKTNSRDHKKRGSQSPLDRKKPFRQLAYLRARLSIIVFLNPAADAIPGSTSDGSQTKSTSPGIFFLPT